MKTRVLLFAALLIIGSFTGFTNPGPPTTDQVLKDAYAQAAREHKKVMVLFHASWCGWCKKMDASLNDPAIKKSFNDNYVIIWLTVLERTPEIKKTENPGAMEFLTKYKGEKAGLPFFLIMDAKGKLLADSQIRPAGASLATPGDNTGCPASEKEVAYFSDILKATSNIKEPQLAAIRERFLKNQPTPAPASSR